MRRVRANIFTRNGEIVYAAPPGRTVEGHDKLDITQGYIEVPLRKGRSRQKGNSLEIEAAKAFSTWLYDRPDVLRRTPLSGGWGSGKLGDLTMDPAIASELKLTPPNLYVECKFHAELLGESFIRWVATGSPKTISDWWVDAEKKAGNKIPMLVLKGNGTEPWVMLKDRCANTHHHSNWLSFPATASKGLMIDFHLFPLVAIKQGIQPALREYILKG